MEVRQKCGMGGELLWRALGRIMWNEVMVGSSLRPHNCGATSMQHSLGRLLVPDSTPGEWHEQSLGRPCRLGCPKPGSPNPVCLEDEHRITGDYSQALQFNIFFFTGFELILDLTPLSCLFYPFWKRDVYPMPVPPLSAVRKPDMHNFTGSWLKENLSQGEENFEFHPCMI